jgi:hypothetical protein
METDYRNLYHFNPGHDLALANGSPTFVPPLAVQQMQRDMSLLPLWYAESACDILSDNNEASRFILETMNLVPALGKLNAAAVTPSDIMATERTYQYEVHPWGWDRAERAYLNRCGIHREETPSDGALSDILSLSNRKMAVQLLSLLHINKHFIGESYYLQDVDACLQFVASRDACVFKAPLSGSGKGLNWYKEGVFSSPFERWCRRQIAQQGGVIAEPIYNKVYDMAVEVYIDDKGKASFAGYSFFNTTPVGVYRHNLLVPDTYRSETPYMKQITEELLPYLLAELGKMFGGRYVGYLGIDMMICSDDEGHPALIHPCVEINTRMTMGILAHAIYNRYIEPEKQGEFHVDYHRQEQEALEFHLMMQRKYPLHINGERIEKGYLNLTPVYSTTHSHAWIVI